MFIWTEVVMIFTCTRSVNSKSSLSPVHVQNICLTWMHPFLKTGTFQRRASRTRAASSRPTSRWLCAAPGFFIATAAQARLHPGHTHLMHVEKGKRRKKGCKRLQLSVKHPFKCLNLHTSWGFLELCLLQSLSRSHSPTTISCVGHLYSHLKS